MDLVVVAAGAVKLLAPFVRKAADQFSGEAGKKVWEVAEGLFGRLKARFASDDDASTALAAFEKDPDGAADNLTTLLERRLEADDELREAVVRAIDEAKRAGGDLRVVQDLADVENVVGVRARRLRADRSVDVNMRVRGAADVTGIEIEDS